MKEIYCQSGKKKVSLPDEAWDSLEGVDITPCSGCQHDYHRKNQARILQGQRDSRQVALEARPVYQHSVSVVTSYLQGKAQEVVVCSCNCRLTFPRS